MYSQINKMYQDFNINLTLSLPAITDRKLYSRIKKLYAARVDITSTDFEALAVHPERRLRC